MFSQLNFRFLIKITQLVKSQLKKKSAHLDSIPKEPH